MAILTVRPLANARWLFWFSLSRAMAYARRMRVLIAALVLITLPSGTVAIGLNSAMEERLRQDHVVGAAYIALRDDVVLETGSYGSADVARQTPITAHTPFHLASLTKIFTATAIMLLVERGEVELDQAISLYLPDSPEAWRSITIRQLLSHTSGLKDYINDRLVDQTRPTTVDAMIGALASTPLEFPPGAAWRYSNSNYLLLGRVIEQVSGISWARFLSREIFLPLHMTDTGLDTEIAGVALGYRWDDSGQHAAWPLQPTVWDNADGGLVSSVSDLSKFVVAIDEGRLLLPRTLEIMRTAVRTESGEMTEAGLGWEVREVRGHIRFEHGGRRSGASVQLTCFQDGLTIIVLANGAVDTIDLADTLAARYAPARGPLTLMQPQPSDLETDTRVRSFLRNAAQGENDAMIPGLAAFANDDRRAMASLNSSVKELEFLGSDRLANPVARHEAPVVDVLYYRARVHPVLFEPHTEYLIFYRTADGRFADFERIRIGAERIAVWVLPIALAAGLLLVLAIFRLWTMRRAHHDLIKRRLG